MKWRSKAWDWKKRFAYFPMYVRGYWYWWVPYWEQFGGDCMHTVFTDPAIEEAALAEGTK